MKKFMNLGIVREWFGEVCEYKIIRDENYQFWDNYKNDRLGGYYPVALAVVVEDNQYNKALEVMRELLKDVKNGSDEDLSLKFKYALAN